MVAPNDSARWWHGAVGYEVYIRSFNDGDGDGIGDLVGIQARLDHLVDLGVEVVWLTPFYPSPMVDFGYDVSDYCEVDPLFGTLEDFDRLVTALHERGLRLVIDIVPNHSSDQHEWFRQAVADPTGPHRDYFIWHDPAPGGGPPNNWVGYFGGSAWTLEPTSGQYYLHLFLPEQPDLNWRNDGVREEFDGILRFWLDRGVDGFRIDVAQALVKDEHLRSNPQLSDWDPSAPRWEQWDAFQHDHDVAQPESLEIYARWRAIVDEYDAMLLGETYVLEAPHLARMLRGDGLHAGFWFEPMHIEWGARSLRATLTEPLAHVADPRRIAWVASSHDEVRPPSRFGGGDRGRRRALAFTTLLMGLPGLPFLYQGEELGLVDGVVPEDRKADPVGADVSLSRDGCRTPMPWEPGVSFGFSTTAATWLPDGGRSDSDTAAIQAADPDSWLNRYRALIALRLSRTDFGRIPIDWLLEDDELVGYRCGSLTVVANTGDAEVGPRLDGRILFSTTGRSGRVGRIDKLAPDEALVVDRSGGIEGEAEQ